MRTTRRIHCVRDITHRGLRANVCVSICVCTADYVSRTYVCVFPCVCAGDPQQRHGREREREESIHISIDTPIRILNINKYLCIPKYNMYIYAYLYILFVY